MKTFMMYVGVWDGGTCFSWRYGLIPKNDKQCSTTMNDLRNSYSLFAFDRSIGSCSLVFAIQRDVLDTRQIATHGFRGCD